MIKKWALFALLFCLPGCLKVGPNFSPPDAPTQDHWLECSDDKVSCEKEDLCAWWDQFNDPVLNDLVLYAKEQNLNLRIAGIRILEARAELGIAVGRWFPQLQQAEGESFRHKLSENAPNTRFADSNYWDFILGLRVAWELDFWGRFRRGIEAAGEELAATVSEFEDVLVILTADVASTYIAVRTLQERIQIVRNNIALQTRSLEIVEARWRAGAVTELDVSQAKTLLYGTSARLPSLEAQLRRTKNALAVLLGVTPAEIDSYLGGYSRIPTAPKNITAGIPAHLLCRRPDIRAALHQTAAQSARIGIAISDLLPRLSLSGFIGFESSDTSTTLSGGGGKFFRNRSLTYVFGPNFVWPILNYGRITNRVKAERMRFFELLVNYQNTVLIAYQEVENGLIAFIKSHEAVDFLKLSVKAAVRATEIARTQYVEGIADYTRVLNTEQARLEEEERYTIARGSIAENLIASYRALGGGW